MTSPAALHTATTGSHYSPERVAELARAVMGRIDLDPFSCATANKVIRAEMIYALEDDGYAQEWGDGAQALFVNPDGERIKRKPARAPKAVSKPGGTHGWWKLLDEYEAGRVEQAVFVSFNMNLFQTAQRFGYRAPFHFPFCVPARRLAFWSEGRPESESDPSHASAVIYLPPSGPCEDYAAGEWGREQARRFARVFGELGQVTRADY